MVSPVGVPSISSKMVWLAALPAAVMCMGVVLYAARRWYMKSREPLETEAFPLDELERLRDSGQITQAEFSALRNRSLGLDSALVQKDKSKSSIGGELDDAKPDAAEG